MKCKKFLLFFFFISMSLPAVAQTITGYIYDELENKPLEGAFVYLDGTTINTSTNEKGYFTLNPGKVYNVPLIVTYTGFENFVLENPFSYNKPVKVLLRMSSIFLDEVVINKNFPFTRKQMLRAFREQFLGETAAGRSCTIENEDDIKLRYNLSTNVLSASSAVPLRIKNKKLEYNINFSLVDFQVAYSMQSLLSANVRQSFYAGTTAFTDVSKEGSAEKKRKKAYLGSTVHLMKTIASNAWAKEKFRLYEGSWPADPDQCFTITDTLELKKISVIKDNKKVPAISLNQADGGNPKTMKFKKADKYNVLYNGKEQSSFELANGRLYIDRNGLFSPIQEINFGGYMATLKAGDLLPADYVYEP
jgi:hypothetical protein